MSDTFVLVHGAGHGAWCWAAVISRLERMGNRVFALDLPGHGASSVPRAQATLGAYVETVVKFIEERNLDHVVLAGHSLGGITISLVAQAIPHRLKRLVYISAIVPRDGQCAIENVPASNPIVQALEKMRSHPDPSVSFDEAQFRAAYVQDGSPALQDFILSALVPEPVAPMLEPISMKNFYSVGVPQSYLFCEDDLSNGGPPHWHEMAGRLVNPTTRSVKSGHEIMFTKPIECARALHELAQD
jgi:pimeloyl-ACP methyl ester carboxylesterase